MDEVKQIQLNGKSPLFDKTGMFHKTLRQRFPPDQVFHPPGRAEGPPGDQGDQPPGAADQRAHQERGEARQQERSAARSSRCGSSFSDDSARLIVQDEGQGFKRLEEWNEFNRRRTECFQRQDFEQMAEFVSFITPDSDEHDSGNALFAALEYWDGGVVFNRSPQLRGRGQELPPAPPRHRAGLKSKPCSDPCFCASDAGAQARCRRSEAASSSFPSRSPSPPQGVEWFVRNHRKLSAAAHGGQPPGIRHHR